MPSLHRSWIIVGYLCYALGLFALFAYLKFPGQQVRSFVVTALHQFGLEQVRIEGVQPLLPLGLSFKGVTVAQDVGGEARELVRFPTLQVRLRSLLLPFTQSLRLGFEGALYGGNVLGSIEWEQNGTPPSLGIRADLRDIRPASHPLVALMGPQAFEGKLAGNVSLRLTDHQLRNGNGRLVIQGDKGNLSAIEVKWMRFPALAYEHLTAELILQQQSIFVKDFSIRGGDWQFEVQGHVRLQEALSQSLLDLTLRVRTSDTLDQQLGGIAILLKQRRDRRGFATFKIGGTLENPSAML
jgi:type II secretion system protein N